MSVWRSAARALAGLGQSGEAASALLAHRLCLRSLPSSPVDNAPPHQLVSLRSFHSRPVEPLLVVQLKKHPAHEAAAEEAVRLAESLTGRPCGPALVVGPSQRFRPVPATFFGGGLVEYIKDAASGRRAARVFVNASLSGTQQRNLEAAWGIPVLDRVGLILEVFRGRAKTREARLQVELALLDYRASRLVRSVDPGTGKRRGFGEGGGTEVVSARERGRSGAGSGGLGGGGGGGESELRLQRQRIAERRRALTQRLAEVVRTRGVQRAGRARGDKPVVALVGYTNAGKTSLLELLSRQRLPGGGGGSRGGSTSGSGGAHAGGAAASAGGEDRLFATLDPALRRVRLPGGGGVIAADTVGFVSDLPPQLVEAFKATLEEVVAADLLLHVIDASSAQAGAQRGAVLGTLRALGVAEARLRGGLIEVWNKSDLLPGGKEGEGPAGLLPEGEEKGPAEAGGGEAAAGAGPGETGDRELGRLEDADGGGGEAPHRVLVSAARGTGLAALLAAIESKGGRGREQ